MTAPAIGGGSSSDAASADPVGQPDIPAERSAWRDRRFIVFASGNTINNIGEAMYAIALPLILLGFTGSLQMMALLAVVAPLVLTLAGPLFGAVVDRYGSRVLVVPGLVLQLSAALTLNVLLLAGRPPIWTFFVFEALVQIGGVGYRAGWMAGIPTMFPDNPARARGALSSCFQLSVVLGPGLAAVLLGAMGYEGLLWINLVTFIAPLITWAVGVKPKTRSNPASGRLNLRRDLREGWSILRNSRQVFAIMLVLLPCGFVFSVGTLTLVLYYLKSDLGLSGGAIGGIVAMANLGALLGAVHAAERPRRDIRRLAILALVGSATCLFILPVTGTVAVVVLILVIFYFLEALLSVAADMVLYASIPAEAIGRTVGFRRLILGAPQFIAPALIAAISGVAGTRAVFGLLGVTALLPGIWLLLRRGAAFRQPA